VYCSYSETVIITVLHSVTRIRVAKIEKTACPDLWSLEISVCAVITCSFSPDSAQSSTNGATALVDLGRFYSFLIHTQSVGILGRGISPA
jgi:hypothetical protein